MCSGELKIFSIHVYKRICWLVPVKAYLQDIKHFMYFVSNSRDTNQTWLTWNLVWHSSIMGQVLPTNQHKVRALDLGISNCHEFTEASCSSHIVARHNDVLLLNSWITQTYNIPLYIHNCFKTKNIVMLLITIWIGVTTQTYSKLLAFKLHVNVWNTVKDTNVHV